MIIRIKNGYLAKHDKVAFPASKLRENIARIMVEAGYATSVERVAKEPQDELVVTLRYVNGKSALTDLERVSKPGRRIYAAADKLPRVLAGYGTAVLSTSQGVMTVKQAKEKKVGGEILFKIW
jgi:small subunit ribosomal protein S8